MKSFANTSLSKEDWIKVRNHSKVQPKVLKGVEVKVVEVANTKVPGFKQHLVDGKSYTLVDKQGNLYSSKTQRADLCFLGDIIIVAMKFKAAITFMVADVGNIEATEVSHLKVIKTLKTGKSIDPF